MKKAIISALALSLLASTSFAADKATPKATKAADQQEMQQIQCIPGTLKERQEQARTAFNQNLAEVEKDGAINKADAAKLKAANEVMVEKVMPFVEKKNPLVFCVNIEADLKARGIPFDANMPNQSGKQQATPKK